MEQWPTPAEEQQVEREPSRRLLAIAFLATCPPVLPSGTNGWLPAPREFHWRADNGPPAPWSSSGGRRRGGWRGLAPAKRKADRARSPRAGQIHCGRGTAAPQTPSRAG